MNIEFTVQTKIKKEIAEVFKAVTEPAHLNRYFTMTSSGPLAKGSSVDWSWSNLPAPQPVIVEELILNQKIILRWKANEVDYKTLVTMAFEPVSHNETLIKIHETGWLPDQAGLNSSYDHCSGWENMVDCLKAYLEFNIDLRVSASKK